MHLAHLINNDKSEYVSLLQRFLVLHGVLHRNSAGEDPVNGKFDVATKAAVKEFQGSDGSDVAGEVAGHTWAKIAGVAGPLEVSKDSPPSPNLPLLKLGDQDPLVTVLQRLLLEYQKPMGADSARFVQPAIFTQPEIEAVSGRFGDKTKKAVESFQSNRGTKERDGNVGRETWEKLLFPRGRG